MADGIMTCSTVHLYINDCIIYSFMKLTQLHVHSLTHSLMELIHSWEAANCAATQELPSILWNPEVHYRVHKSPSLVPILID
jgi:hypothetical protein